MIFWAKFNIFFGQKFGAPTDHLSSDAHGDNDFVFVFVFFLAQPINIFVAFKIFSTQDHELELRTKALPQTNQLKSVADKAVIERNTNLITLKYCVEL